MKGKSGLTYLFNKMQQSTGADPTGISDQNFFSVSHNRVFPHRSSKLVSERLIEAFTAR